MLCAEFSEVVQGEPFAFTVRRRDESNDHSDLILELTERGRIVVSLWKDAHEVTINEWEKLGRSGVAKLLSDHGEARVRSVLAGA